MQTIKITWFEKLTGIKAVQLWKNHQPKEDRP
jgi:hypothetical protein